MIKRNLTIKCSIEERKQFEVFQKQNDFKVNSSFATRREINTELKSTFFNVPEQHYMDDPTNLTDIKLYDRRVLVIGDLHSPFDLNGYLEHCIDMYFKWKCDTVVFIGDILDNHYASYHETDPNGFGGQQELDRAISRIKPWFEAFPKAYVTIGNHDRLIMRKAVTSNVPRQWIRTYKSVLETPTWVFCEELEIDNVLYIHGEGGQAKGKAKNNLQSTVQGHLHSQAYIEWYVGTNTKIFGMQVGCGVDIKSYAMAYGKNFKKPIISCGAITNGNPYLELMQL